MGSNSSQEHVLSTFYVLGPGLVTGYVSENKTNASPFPQGVDILVGEQVNSAK